MFYALSWFLIATILAIWSIGVWMTHSLLVWSIGGIGMIAGQPRQPQVLELPEVVALWVPAELLEVVKLAASSAVPFVESALSFLPSIAGWLSPISWGVWGIGTLSLLAIGAVLHAVIFSMLHVAKR